jgi:hypothetical protein
MSKKHICIDFEGEGKKDGKAQQPHLLGALVPDLNGKGKTYHLWLLRPELEPMERSSHIPGNPINRKTCSLKEAIRDLLAFAEERDCRLIAYSIHEETMIHDHLPESSRVRRVFDQRFFNVKPKANALRKRRKLKAPDDKLDSLLRALMPKHKVPPPPKCKAAEACRRLSKAGIKSKRWRSWPTKHQQLAIDLIAYNKGDCTAVWKLVNRVAANYELDELN